MIYEDSMNTGFGRSYRGYFLLQFLGYSKAAILHGGYKAWLAEALPTSVDTPAPSQRHFRSMTSASVMLTRDDMLASLEDEDIIKLDVRDVDEWVGPASPMASISVRARGAFPAQFG